MTIQWQTRQFTPTKEYKSKVVSLKTAFKYKGKLTGQPENNFNLFGFNKSAFARSLREKINFLPFTCTTFTRCHYLCK